MASFDLSARFTTVRDEGDYEILCFTCAVKAIIEEGKKVEMEIDEFGLSGNDMRQTYCDRCTR